MKKIIKCFFLTLLLCLVFFNCFGVLCLNNVFCFFELIHIEPTVANMYFAYLFLGFFIAVGLTLDLKIFFFLIYSLALLVFCVSIKSYMINLFSNRDPSMTIMLYVNLPSIIFISVFQKRLLSDLIYLWQPIKGALQKNWIDLFRACFSAIARSKILSFIIAQKQEPDSVKTPTLANLNFLALGVVFWFAGSYAGGIVSFISYCAAILIFLVVLIFYKRAPHWYPYFLFFGYLLTVVYQSLYFFERSIFHLHLMPISYAFAEGISRAKYLFLISHQSHFFNMFFYLTAELVFIIGPFFHLLTLTSYFSDKEYGNHKNNFLALLPQTSLKKLTINFFAAQIELDKFAVYSARGAFLMYCLTQPFVLSNLVDPFLLVFILSWPFLLFCLIIVLMGIFSLVFSNKTSVINRVLALSGIYFGIRSFCLFYGFTSSILADLK